MKLNYWILTLDETICKRFQFFIIKLLQRRSFYRMSTSQMNVSQLTLVALSGYTYFNLDKFENIEIQQVDIK